MATAFATRGPTAVAGEFLSGWLACIYRGGCTQLTGALPRYTVALVRDDGTARATPAERVARPQTISLRLTQSCRLAAVVTASYMDGESGRFQLHINLVREARGWRVFDVAEAPPHISPPRPLTHSPLGC